MTKLSILILSFNTKELILGCIESIQKQYKEQLDTKEFEIIVIDNASTDGTPEAIRVKKRAENITIIENKENYGFSKGNNIGVKRAKGEYILFLNSDTLVLDKGLEDMVCYLDQHSKIGILGARLKNNDGSNQPSAGNFYNLLSVLLLLLGGERIGLLRSSPNKITIVDWVSGGSMMVRKKMFEELKGFNEDFFMYLEDMDLCFRAYKKGWLTYFYPSITISHMQHGSSNRAFAIKNIYKGILLFYKKHKSRFEYSLVKILLRVKAQVLIFAGRVLDNTYLTKTYEEALAVCR